MTWISARLSAWGERFDPSSAESSARVRFSSEVQRGELATRGRYAGQATPYGSAEWTASPAESASPDASVGSLDLRWLEQLAEVVPACRSAGAAEVVLHLDVRHDGQCNLTFEPSELRAVAALGIPMTVTCYPR